MRGRKKVPTKLHLLQGGTKKTHRKKSASKEPEPKISKLVPKPPKRLSGAGKKEWKRIGKQLHEIGLLTEVDLTAFEAYCVTYQTWLEAIAKIKEFGMLVKAPGGFPVPTPYVSIANKAMIEMRKWLVEFGMTPSSRSRLNIQAKEKEDPLDSYLKKGR